MFKYNKRVSFLEEKKEELLSSNKELRGKIDETKKLTAEFDQLWEEDLKRMNGYAGTRGGMYGIMRNTESFNQWKDTVFWTKKKELDFPNTWTLKRLPEREIIGNDIVRPEWKWDFDFNICAYCDMVLPTSHGPIVHITDPFGDYYLPPAKNTTNEEAQELIGYVILTKCVMRYYQKDYEVVGFEKLPYSLHAKIA